MIFLNNNPHRKFRKIKNLFVYGYSNYTDSKLCSLLENKNPPHDIRGQFAYVYIEKNYVVACVDHFATTNLFYTDELITPDFHDAAEYSSMQINQLVVDQLKILKNHTVGEDTIYCDIKRVQHEHMLINNKQVKYLDILNDNVEYDLDDIYEKYKKVCFKYDLSDSTFLFSGGKDSGFLSMLLLEFGLLEKTKMVTICSSKSEHGADLDAIKRYEKELGYDISYYNVEHRDVFREDQYLNEFWSDGVFSLKRRAGAGKKYCLTGEIGAGLSKKNGYGSYINNMEGKIKVDDIINIYIHSQFTHGKRDLPKACNPKFLDWLVQTDAYEYILNYYRDIINNIDKPDELKYFNFFHPSHHSFRLYHQSQCDMNQFFCIFADYDIQSAYINCDWKHKHQDRIGKFNLYELGKNKFKKWRDISWDYPPTGMGILGS